MRRAVALLAGLGILVLANLSIHGRERLLAEGRVVLLELAPVDPRSLMQGDYMALRFQVADAAFQGAEGSGNTEERRRDGHLILRLDARNVASFARFETLGSNAPLAGEEVRLRYRLREGLPKLATNAYFFEEGQADRYAAARYGEFRVGNDGEAILTRLRDAALKPL